MKRIIPTIACLLALAIPAASAAPPARPPVLVPIKVSPHVYYFHGKSGMADTDNQGFMSNAGFVVTRDGVVVFDALGTPALGEAMLKAIRKVTAQPVRRVIVSHYHADHFYGLQAFKAKGAQIWAHERGRAYLGSEMAATRLAQRKEALAPWVDDATRLTGADRWLSFADGKNMAFEMGGVRFRIIDMSGAHAPDDIMLAVDDDQVLFAGDLFFSGRIPFVGEADSRVWLDALERMLALAPKAAIPGHGELSRTPARDIALTRDYLSFLRRVMGEAVADLADFDEAYGKIDWSAFDKYPAFAQANRLNAYGTYLLMERESLQQKRIPGAPKP
ncbi:MBL fold metallo-hydrolase [Massilia atriviolacea]|uniref:MBL fold metallo-hydrolase n=1 Tax=Massilia atriviolacea TaxID=2495579 RepID=A0A430HSU7_9BURK|nr:MBL fold metallo-hydrolase [Massilia atriviolacea]RSZ60618.1 MBL fold metallo-hydrolase [Massilia atriviolacea]